MTALITRANIVRPDDVYERLVAMHDGLDSEQSRIASAALILLLANHIGEMTAIEQAIALASKLAREAAG
jgi:hypothetical protein